MTFRGEVVAIHITSDADAPMRTVERVRALAGVGLDGDRYAAGRGSFSGNPGPGRQVTFIEMEALDAAAAEAGMVVTAADSRRNVATRGVPLNHLVGREFVVGDARFRGVKLCEPCGQLQRKLDLPGLVGVLAHRAGLNAEVLTTGEVAVGDPVAPVDVAVGRAVAR